MPGRSSQSTIVQAIGALVALVAVVGYVVFDWRFGSGDVGPLLMGVGAAILAIGLTVYRWRNGG